MQVDARTHTITNTHSLTHSQVHKQTQTYTHTQVHTHSRLHFVPIFPGRLALKCFAVSRDSKHLLAGGKCRLEAQAITATSTGEGCSNAFLLVDRAMSDAASLSAPLCLLVQVHLPLFAPERDACQSHRAPRSLAWGAGAAVLVGWRPRLLAAGL